MGSPIRRLLSRENTPRLHHFLVLFPAHARSLTRLCRANPYAPLFASLVASALSGPHQSPIRIKASPKWGQVLNDHFLPMGHGGRSCMATCVRSPWLAGAATGLRRARRRLLGNSPWHMLARQRPSWVKPTMRSFPHGPQEDKGQVLNDHFLGKLGQSRITLPGVRKDTRRSGL
jgi:hypothetical protein